MASCNSAPPRPEAACRRNSPSGEPSPLRFVAAVCAAGEPDAGGAPRVPEPAEDDLVALADEAPPMRGGEYLDAECLASLWRGLEQALDDELSKSGLAIQAFLNSRDSRWRLVGRVHFNLAENRKDSERPFAFMATYASMLGAQGGLRHLGLGHALARICRRRSEDRAPQAPGAGQPRGRKLRLAEGDRRLGRDLSSRCAGRRGRRCGSSPTSRRWSGPASSCACRPRGA